MTTAQLDRTTDDQLPDEPLRDAAHRARIGFRQPVSPTGFIDAAWWPRSRDLAAELPALLDVLWTAGREINRTTYDVHEWGAAPRRMQIEGRTVRLGSFTVGVPDTVTLFDPWGSERVDILVIAPDTEPGLAQRIIDLADQAGSSARAEEILDRAARTTDDDSRQRS